MEILGSIQFNPAMHFIKGIRLQEKKKIELLKQWWFCTDSCSSQGQLQAHVIACQFSLTPALEECDLPLTPDAVSTNSNIGKDTHHLVGAG